MHPYFPEPNSRRPAGFWRHHDGGFSGTSGEVRAHRNWLKRADTLSVLPALLLLVFWLANLPTIQAAAMPITAFAGERPAFDPLKFYTGHTRSWGIFESGSGEPTERINTETWGRVVRGELHMEQDLYIGRQPRSHRSWIMRRIDAHHFEATANDILGTARGEARGNAFFWTFTLATKPGNPLFNVRMTQHMYLQPDGKTMINRDTVRKFGLEIAAVTEQFRRL